MQRSISSIVFLSILSIATIGRAGFGDLNPRFDFTFGDSSGMPDDVVDTTGQQTSADGKSVKLFGTMGPLDGARFRNGFVFYFSGDYDGALNIGSAFEIDIDFVAQATGGEMTWRFQSNLWNGESSNTSAVILPLPSGVTQNLQLSLQIAATSTYGQFSGYVHIDWTGYSPTDTITVTIPENSIDITLVPEPGALALLIAGLMASMSARKFSR